MKKYSMNKIKSGARSRDIFVREDRKRSSPRMTRDKGGWVQQKPRSTEYTNDWEEWWYFGCGRGDNGVPFCTPGHAYYIEKRKRKIQATMKKLGRRRDRRRNNRKKWEDEY